MLPILPTETHLHPVHAPTRDFASIIIALTAYLLFISICTVVIAVYLAKNGRFRPSQLLKQAHAFVQRKPRRPFETARGSDLVLRFVRAEWRGKRVRSADVESSSGGKVSLLESELFTDFQLRAKEELVSVRVVTEDNAVITDKRTVAELMLVQERREMLGSTVFIWKLAGDISLHFQVITFDELVI